jgi:hypothetical protein
MQTKRTPKLFGFEAVERRSVVAGFDGGNITSNAGALPLGQIDRGIGLVRRFAAAAAAALLLTASLHSRSSARTATSCSRVGPNGSPGINGRGWRSAATAAARR